MSRHFALVPAAGTGTRMGGGPPKQYLPLAGRPMLYHALAALCASPRIQRLLPAASAAMMFLVVTIFRSCH